MDNISQQILQMLLDDGRATYTHIAKTVNLSAPAVKERIQKLEEEGIITGYKAQVNQAALGYSIEAFMLVKVPSENDKTFTIFAQNHPNITECFHILGEYDFMLRLRLKDMPQLETFIESCLEYGHSTTYMIFSQLKS